MKHVWSIVLLILAVLAALLGWMGFRSVAHGLDDAAGLTEDSKGLYLLLGCFQLCGAALALFGIVRFARAWRLLPSAKRTETTETSIRERALANMKAAQSPRSQA